MYNVLQTMVRQTIEGNVEAKKDEGERLGKRDQQKI